MSKPPPPLDGLAMEPLDMIKRAGRAPNAQPAGGASFGVCKHVSQISVSQAKWNCFATHKPTHFYAGCSGKDRYTERLQTLAIKQFPVNLD